MLFTEVRRSRLSKVVVVDAGTATSSRPGFFHQCGLLSVLVAASLLVFTTVHADTVPNAAETIKAQLSPMLDSLTQASVSMARQDRATASMQLGLTISLASGLSSIVQSAEMVATLGKSAKALQRGVSRFQNRLARAKTLVDEPVVANSAALRAMLTAVSDGQRLRKLMLKIPASDTVVMVKEAASRGIALHYSGDVVCFRVDILNDNGSPSCGPMDVSVTNLGGDPSDLVVMGTPSLSSSTDFCLIMGPDADTLRVTVTACGQSSSILLYNYGVPKKSGRAMDPPQNLAITTSSFDAIQLAWSSSAKGAEGFNIERSATGGEPWTRIGLTDINTTVYTDSGLTASSTYYYRVRTYHAKGYSDYSNAASGSTTVNTDDGSPSILVAPSNLATAAVTPTYITLNWQDNSNNETGYQIERAPAASGPWSVVGTTGPDAISFTDTGLEPSTTYWYRVTAFN